MDHKAELKKIKKWYAEELKRRDKEIEELKKQNVVLMKASLKSAGKIAELTEKVKKAYGK